MTAATPRFAVVTDGGLDALPSLLNAVPVAPFSVNFGEKSYSMHAISREELYQALLTGHVHPTSAQPSPQDWLAAFEEAGRVWPGVPVLAIAISTGLSGSANAAEQAAQLFGGPVTVRSCGTISGAQAFQVHAAAVAAERGLEMQTALDWMEKVHQESEFFFTIETLDYLRKGGRIGRVAAALGGLLNLKPIITVDKAAGIYTTVSRARSYRGALDALAAQVTRTYGEGTPLRVALLYGSHEEDADAVLEKLRAHHPILWTDRNGVNPVLSVHVGPRAIEVTAAPGDWPWERGEA